MAKPLCLISSDWHIEESAWRRRSDLSGDAIYSLSQIIGYQVEHQLSHFALGDLYEDAEPTPKEVKQVNELIDVIAQDKLPIYYIQGQHEWVRECPDTPWLNLTDWPLHFHRRVIRLGDFVFYGLDYTPVSKIQEELDRMHPDANVLATHQVWKDFISIGTGANISFADVPRVKYVLTGDFHSHLIQKHAGKNGQLMTVVSPGSICLKKLDEACNKFFFVMHDDGSFTSVPIKTRTVYRHQIDNDADMQWFLDEFLPGIVYDTSLPANIQKPILDIEYNTNISNAYSRLLHKIGDTCHGFIKPKKQVVSTQEISVENRQKQILSGMKGCLPLVAQDPEIRRTVERVLDAENVSDELQTMYQEALGNVDRAVVS